MPNEKQVGEDQCCVEWSRVAGTKNPGNTMGPMTREKALQIVKEKLRKGEGTGPVFLISVRTFEEEIPRPA